MIRHTVYFWLNDAVIDQEKKIFEQGLKNLVKKIEQVQKWEIGIPGPTAHRNITDHSFNYSLLVWFKSLEDHNIYMLHPEHQKFEETYMQFLKKVKVYDSTIIGSL